MAEIQRGIVKGGKRNAISRVFHAKDDQGTIAAWRLDLNRILHIFNVRSITSVWPWLTAHFQTELAINTNVVVSDVHRGVANTYTVVSDVHQGVVNTHTVVSEIHRVIVQNQEGTDGKNQSVSVARAPFIAEPTLTVP